MTSHSLNPDETRFLMELFEKIDGMTAGSTSMYDIGAGIGLDRDAARQVAENLMSEGLIEIRTLSGGVAVTEDGIEAARELGAGDGGDSQTRLTDGPILDGPGREAAEALSASLKAHAGKLELAFDPLSELMADLRTIDAQLASPRPKTAVLRACLESIRKVLASAGAKEEAAKVDRLLGSA